MLKRHVSAVLHPAIRKALEGVDKAEQKLKETLQLVQDKCKHVHVLHADTRSQTYFAPLAPRRICQDCGLEESAAAYHDRDWDLGHWKKGHCPYKLTTEFVQKVSHEVVWANRIP